MTRRYKRFSAVVVAIVVCSAPGCANQEPAADGGSELERVPAETEQSDAIARTDEQRARLAAGQGYAVGQYSLGLIYNNGRGVPRDDAEAARWYRLAADQGLTEAQYRLGLMYNNGRGVPRDDAEAARWYRLAADQGHAEAQYSLGLLYVTGRGVSRNDVTAYMWFDLVALRSTGAIRDNGIHYRDLVTQRMTAIQIADTQRLAREWDAAHPRN